jgi:hypothetical protein
MQILQNFFLEADALDFALGLVLSQYDEDGRLYPIAYCSRKFSTAKTNFEIHDKELVAIIDAFEKWRQSCQFGRLSRKLHPKDVCQTHPWRPPANGWPLHLAVGSGG